MILKISVLQVIFFLHKGYEWSQYDLFFHHCNILMKEVERNKYCYTRNCTSFIIMPHQFSNGIQMSTHRTQMLLKYERPEFNVSHGFSWNVCPWSCWISVSHSMFFPLDYITAIKCHELRAALNGAAHTFPPMHIFLPFSFS